MVKRLARYGLMAALAVAAIGVQAESPEELAGKAVASLKRQPKWESVQVQRARADDYSLIIWYRAMPDGYAEVERDTKLVARAMLKTLVDAGIKPAEQRISIFTRGRKHEKGETGQPVTRVFGRTAYDWTNDQLSFDAKK